jgi:hypothetical protein
VHLEPKLGEEPTVRAGLEASLELFLDDAQHLLLLGRVGHFLRVDGLFERELDAVTSRHQMVVVVHLQEGLHFAVAFTTLLGKTTDDLAGVTVDAGHQSMTERLVRAAFVEVLDDDGFATSETTVHHQDNLGRLHNLHHFDWIKCVFMCWALMAKRTDDLDTTKNKQTISVR